MNPIFMICLLAAARAKAMLPACHEHYGILISASNFALAFNEAAISILEIGFGVDELSMSHSPSSMDR
jgi:hypothetical protein